MERGYLNSKKPAFKKKKESVKENMFLKFLQWSESLLCTGQSAAVAISSH